MMVAARMLRTMGVRRLAWRLEMTLSRKYFDDAGSTSPATRLMAISTKPSASKPRRGWISAQISGSDFQADFFFAAGSDASAARDRRSDRRTSVGITEDRGKPWGMAGWMPSS